MFEIKFIGNQHTNKSSRGKHIPFVIVNHISSGSMKSMDNWFTTPTNTVSSAHFGISKEGVIHQYVKIEEMAWHAGLRQDGIQHATSKVVKDENVNPNLYSVGIEHEGFDGELTPIQFEASIWLHQYIREYVKEKYNKDIPFDNYHIVGHCHVDPRRKPNCPGPKFPWKQLYSDLQDYEDELAIEDDLKELQKTVEKLVKENDEMLKKVIGIQNNMALKSVPSWANDAINKAVAKGIVKENVGGSEGFYRIMTILNRKGLI